MTAAAVAASRLNQVTPGQQNYRRAPVRDGRGYRGQDRRRHQLPTAISPAIVAPPWL